MIEIFKRIKGNLVEIYRLLQENPDLESSIQKDLLITQQLTIDLLKKLKRNIASSEASNQGDLFR